MRQLLLIIILSIWALQTGWTQVGIGTINPDPSAMLDIRQSENHKGILIPRVTQLEKNQIIAPANGLLLYQTDGTSGFYFYNGTIWKFINPDMITGATGPTGPQGSTGPQGPAGASVANTDSQTLSLAGNILAISSGNSVTLSTSSTDSQTIAAVLSGTILELLPENTTTSVTIDLSSINSTNTLEQVTAVGSTTSNGITVSGTLIVNNDIEVGERIYHLGDNNTYIQYIPDDIRFIGGGFDTLKSLPGETNLNAGGVDMDFRISTNTKTNTFFVEGISDNIGIGTDTPLTDLHVFDTFPRITLEDSDNSNDRSFLDQENGLLSLTARNGSNYGNIALRTWNGSSGVYNMYIRNDGNVGIGTTSPSTKLEVFGTVSATNLFITGTSTFTNDITATQSVTIEGNLKLQDADIAFVNQGSFPTSGKGFFWDLNDDEARIFAQQPSSDRINFNFYLADNTDNLNDRYVFWHDHFTGTPKGASTADDRYPLVMDADNFYIFSPSS